MSALSALSSMTRPSRSMKPPVDRFMGSKAPLLPSRITSASINTLPVPVMSSEPQTSSRSPPSSVKLLGLPPLPLWATSVSDTRPVMLTPPPSGKVISVSISTLPLPKMSMPPPALASMTPGNNSALLVYGPVALPTISSVLPPVSVTLPPERNTPKRGRKKPSPGSRPSVRRPVICIDPAGSPSSGTTARVLSRA